MMNDVPKTCDDCLHGKRLYADGYIYKDWSGQFTGDISALPKVPDPDKFWTYLECARNSKGLKFMNFGGSCNGFARKTK
jgi:hypothetical protein